MTYPKDYINKIICGECITVMKDIPDKSIDLILCDLPYGTTQIGWDIIIPFDLLWPAYERIIKDNGAIVLTASQPFTTDLIASNRAMFRYEMIWEKSRAVGFLDANRKPMKAHENILVFYKSLPTYNPIMTEGKPYIATHKANRSAQYSNHGETVTTNEGERYPRSVIKIDSISDTVHPTQKPVELFEYLIRTFTHPTELVLDNCVGSGTTAVAAKNLNRKFIGIELNETYCYEAEKRLKQGVLNF